MDEDSTPPTPSIVAMSAMAKKMAVTKRVVREDLTGATLTAQPSVTAIQVSVVGVIRKSNYFGFQFMATYVGESKVEEEEE